MSSTKVDLKVIVLGKESIGKTCLVHRYLYGRYKFQSSTVGAAFGSKKVEQYGREFIMGIWDTAGQERFESMSRIYYKDAKAAIVCYDITSEESYNKLTFWTNELVTNEPECVIFLVGTKLDLLNDGMSKREVTTEKIENFATQNGISLSNIFETSAKEGTNVNELFAAVARVYDGKKNNSDDENLVDLTKKKEPAQGNGGCC